MRYLLVLFAAVALFQAASGEGAGHGKRKRETGSPLEAFATFQKTLGDQMGNMPVLPLEEEVRAKRESEFFEQRNEGDIVDAAGSMTDFFQVPGDEKPTLREIRDIAKQLLETIRIFKADTHHDECKKPMYELMRKIINLILQLITKLIAYIMAHIDFF